MKAPPFDYLAPASLDEALDALAQHGDEAKVLAGGQSLVPILALRLAHPGWLVDLGRIRELGEMAIDGAISISANVTQRQAERDSRLAAAHPLLAEALPLIAHPQIRNRGTVCGSLAHADPAAELPAVALAAGATMIVRGPKATRAVKAEDFFVSYLETAIGADEVLSEVRFDRLGAGTGTSVQEISRRHGDFAMAGAATIVRLAADGAISGASIALFGVASTPVRAHAAEALIAGLRFDADLAAAAAEAARRDLDPPSDVHASSAYRRHVAGVLVARTLTTAHQRALVGLR